MCRLAAAHETIRLMLLGLPPDMVHGVLLHRARTSIFRNFLIIYYRRSHAYITFYHIESELSSVFFLRRQKKLRSRVFAPEHSRIFYHLRDCTDGRLPVDLPSIETSRPEVRSSGWMMTVALF